MIRHLALIAALPVALFISTDARAFPPIRCGIPPWDPPTPNQVAPGHPDAASDAAAQRGAAPVKAAGYSLSPLAPAPSASLDFNPGPIGTLPGWDGGTGEACHLFHASDAVDWSSIAQINYTTPDFVMGYIEAPLHSVAPGQALELRLQLDLSELVATADPAVLAFVELDLDRGDLRPLLPLRLAVHSTMNREPWLQLQAVNANAATPRVLQAGAPGHSVSELRLHWRQLDRQRGEVSLRLDGRVLGSNVVVGSPVALRVGDLDLPAGDTRHGAIRLRSASLRLQP